MPRRELNGKQVVAYLLAADIHRLKQLAVEDGITLSSWIRACINDRLEDQGDPILKEVKPRGQPRRVQA